MKRAGLMLLAALNGCSMVPRYHRPAPPVPAQFPSGGAYSAPTEMLPSVNYRDIFADARLQKLIAEALENNRNLRIAAANIAAARATYQSQRAERLPLVNSPNSLNIIDPGTGRTNAGGAPITGGQRANYSLGLGVNAFEIDLFGRVAALAEAEQARYFASEAGARATWLTLIGDIATAWLQHGADRSLLSVAEATRANAARSVALTRARVDGGIAPRGDLAQAEEMLAAAEADRAAQTTLVAQDANALQLLVGAAVDPTLLPPSIEDAAPTIAALPAGLDSAVLLRRPDIVQAEYQLRAANAQVGAARAALFPRLSLTVAAGLASNGLSQLFTTQAFNYSATPAINYPVFGGGRGKAAVAQARAQFDAAVATYERAIQTAFREVADALARRGTIGDQLAAQARQTSAANEAYRLSEARYRGGIDGFLPTLVTQRTLYQAQRALIAARLIEAANKVTLYRTLGGDALIDATDKGPTPAAQ